MRLGEIDLGATPWRLLLLSERHDVWTLVDADDWDWIIATRWNPGWWANTPWKRYAKRNVGAARATVYLHREIMHRCEPREDAAALVVDHVNGQSLDNRKSNLRWATVRENNANRLPWERVPTLETIVARLLRAHAGTREETVPF